MIRFLPFSDVLWELFRHSLLKLIINIYTELKMSPILNISYILKRTRPRRLKIAKLWFLIGMQQDPGPLWSQINYSSLAVPWGEIYKVLFKHTDLGWQQLRRYWWWTCSQCQVSLVWMTSPVVLSILESDLSSDWNSRANFKDWL